MIDIIFKFFEFNELLIESITLLDGSLIYNELIEFMMYLLLRW